MWSQKDENEYYEIHYNYCEDKLNPHKKEALVMSIYCVLDAYKTKPYLLRKFIRRNYDDFIPHITDFFKINGTYGRELQRLFIHALYPHHLAYDEMTECSFTRLKKCLLFISCIVSKDVFDGVVKDILNLPPVVPQESDNGVLHPIAIEIINNISAKYN